MIDEAIPKLVGLLLGGTSGKRTADAEALCALVDDGEVNPGVNTRISDIF